MPNNHLNQPDRTAGKTPPRWAKIIGYVIIVFAAVSLALFFYQCIRNINKFHEIDLTSYIRASVWFFSGENPYQEVARRFIYPLFLLIVVYPLHWLTATPLAKGIAAAIWSAGLYACFFFAVVAGWQRLVPQRSSLVALRANLLPTAILIIMAHPLLQDEFLNGQVNLFVLGATVAFFVFAEKRQDFLAALMLAIAASIKIAPGLCLVYLLFSRRYRPAWYIIPLGLILTVGLPLLINPHSLDYYRYFVFDVMPKITGSDFEGGFRSFSVISTLSYLFGIHWYPPLKIAAVGTLALALLVPIHLRAGRHFADVEKLGAESAGRFRYVTFAAIVAVLPLTFPMSEAHHLLLQVVPFTAMIWYGFRKAGGGWRVFFSDRLILLFLLSALGYQIGHGLKDTPIRLLSLIGVYTGMLMLLSRLRRGTVEETAQG